MLTRADLEQIDYKPDKKVWTQEEDEMLIYLRKKRNMDWEAISYKMEGRNKKMCYSRFKRLKSSVSSVLRHTDEMKLRCLLG